MESNNDIVHKKAKDDNGVGTVRFSFAIQNQSSARMVKEHLRSLSSNIGIDIQPVFRSKSVQQIFRSKEKKPDLISNQCVVYHCDDDYVGFTTRYSVASRHPGT